MAFIISKEQLKTEAENSYYNETNFKKRLNKYLERIRNIFINHYKCEEVEIIDDYKIKIMDYSGNYVYCYFDYKNKKVSFMREGGERIKILDLDSLDIKLLMTVALNPVFSNIIGMYVLNKYI